MITVPASLPVTAAAAQKRPAAVNGQVGIGLAVYIMPKHMVLKGGGDVIFRFPLNFLCTGTGTSKGWLH